ncbi:PAS domain-containing protein [Oscillochloris sp. ZM17-4]|uniref:PAS domain-containing protein n=1 Tax=Oscillochloris sp. ZM17-4 TaxID=2866714 RepID=UPI001C739564|nr:PAS domain-containing protein [Oscillochloris sp. ZM17-4]MBX0327349.1 PAS domain-containing protein [Oscillochloris sp. ZM17-4]
MRAFVQIPDGSGYRVHKTIRDLLIFSVQDVIKDPPFSKLNLISCRNLLIYMNADLQRKLIPLFHYALAPSGVLFLGTSETIGEFMTLFSALDRKWKLYMRQEGSPGTARPALSDFVPILAAGDAAPQLRRGASQTAAKVDLRSITERSLLAHYDPVGILVNSRGEILHIVGRSGSYLEPAPGDAGMNMLSMAREGLRRELTTALHRAVSEREPVRYAGLRVRTNGSFTTVNLTVRPATAITAGASVIDAFLVVIEEALPTDISPPQEAEGAESPGSDSERRIAALEHELRAKEEYLQTTLEEMETANEELMSANEELQSLNEELQSTNEELETSKEELQSVNEELSTVNAELQNKVFDLSRANNDMNNLLAGTGVGTLFVDMDLRISRFTPAITHVINLIKPDVGRPVGDIASNLVGYSRLVEDVREVHDTLVPKDAEVQTRLGTWYLMSIRPYRTLEHMIEGAVLTFVDISQRKLFELALRSSEAKFAKAFRAIPDGLVVCQQSDGVVLDINASWEALFGSSRQQIIGRSLHDLRVFADPADWQRVRERLQQDGAVRDMELETLQSSGGRRWTLLSAEQLEGEAEPSLIMIFHDITERRKNEQARQTE